ncbi:MAG: hypothetical protein EOP04_05230 [Proteobacteria bacterium]|nr:MAG: hypothetical protein EOP04_05230 [Pseudomonadota bacterium]
MFSGESTDIYIFKMESILAKDRKTGAETLVTTDGHPAYGFRDGDVVEDVRGAIWFFDSITAEIARISEKRLEHFLPPFDKKVDCIFTLGDSIFISTGADLYRKSISDDLPFIPTGKPESMNSLPAFTEGTKCVRLSASSIAFAWTDNSDRFREIYIFDKNNNLSESIEIIETGISFESLKNCLALSKNKSLYLFTESGLYKYIGRKWEMITDILEFKDSPEWFGFEVDGLVVTDDEKVFVKTSNPEGVFRIDP